MSKSKGKITQYYQIRKKSVIKNPLNKLTATNNLNENNFDSDSSSSSVEKNLPVSEQIINFNSNMGTATFKISEALKIIDPFDGSPSNLHKFIACCDLVQTALKPSDHIKFLGLMKYLLTGRAYDETVKHINYEDWPTLRNDLKLRYTDIRSKQQLSHELLTIFQKPNEDVRSFGARVEKLLSEFNDICITEAGAGSERYVEALNSQTALTSFQEGLTQNIRLIVKAYRCDTLRDAISRACEEEALTKRFGNLNRSSDKNIMKCQFCKKNGHSADKCFAIPGNKIENKSNLNSNNSSNSANSKSSSKPNSFSQSKLICSYCKKIGHHINDCYGRKIAESKKSKNEQPLSVPLNVIKQDSQTHVQPSENIKSLEQSIPNTIVRAKDLI